MSRSSPPVIGVTACFKQAENGFRFHSAGEKYVEAALLGAGGLPLIVPALGAQLAVDPLLDVLDGLLVTGSPSNVAPEIYGGPPARAGNEADPVRDATTLPLLRRALDRGIPVFAICRGLQELNVALGGTLHQHVQDVPGRIDHRSDKSLPMEQRYRPAHPVDIEAEGFLARLLGGETHITVNSLHGQGIDRVAPSLRVEATAPDGTIEAVSVRNAPGFALAVQWHPEWEVLSNPNSSRMFTAFGDACRAHAATRQHDARSGAMA